MSSRDRDDTATAVAFAGLLVAACVVSLPAVVAGAAIGRLLRRRRLRLAAAALAGLAGTVVVVSQIEAAVGEAFAAARATGDGRIEDQVRAAWPHMRDWWLWALPLAPLFSLAFELARPPTVEELRERDERRRGRRAARRERRARRAVGIHDCVGTPVAFDVGRHVDGDRVLPVRRGRVSVPLEALSRTALVVGAPGSGKTETLLRLAAGVTACSDWQVFVLDAKGDPATARRFCDLMRRCGRVPTLFPGHSTRHIRRRARTSLRRGRPPCRRRCIGAHRRCDPRSYGSTVDRRPHRPQCR